MTDVIDSLIETVKDPFNKYPDFDRVYWEDIPDSQKMVKQAGNSGQTLSGYGDKIPTDKMVSYRGRLYRVYCRIYSNSGTLYFISGGRRIIVA